MYTFYIGKIYGNIGIVVIMHVANITIDLKFERNLGIDICSSCIITR